MEHKIDQRAIIAIAAIAGFVTGVIFTNVVSKGRASAPKPAPEANIAQNEDISSDAVSDEEVNRLVLEMKQNSFAWTQIEGWGTKQKVVERYIEIYQNQGVVIQKSPMHYFVLIESLTNQNPPLLKQPFDIVLRIVAIMEYDFDNGEDKDKLAREILNEKEFLENKTRLGLQ